MKKIIIPLALLLVAVACKSPLNEEIKETPVPQKNAKNFTFTIKGDFGAAVFTRGYLQADGQDMTDLWVFDFVNGQCVQSMHQTNSDADWGTPKMSLAYGQHHVYFVASRGAEPSLDESGHVLSWQTVRDTFWKDYEVSVVSTSNGNRAVTLDRVATKLRVAVNDEVPSGCATLSITPDRWYYGLNYVTGAAVSAQKKAISVSVPSSYIGTTGQLVMSVFGISSADEWTTNVAVTATDASSNVIGSASISGAPFKRNRATEYSGNLFNSSGGLDVSVNTNWETSRVGTW